ncbi:hypothetical protein BBC27_06975 [Acidithiobacillus ferrivorans]|uniref:DUF2062 domain-containing protein n=1 Tax=Acidithiobacillus ferrivorans TaxID=160808 RepID=A0A1B9C144_9PROT|nr:DUF2062 domain-containing protein [Acidithiobacillus ferrivorans]OCB03661.1 hypothetical protein BBC27_06975 [Acidithiobacillus ferrivorans]
MRLPAFCHLPTREDVLSKRPLGRFTHYLARPILWHPHRHNVARAVAIGTFIGSLPFFGHVLSILLISLWRRAYIPVGVVMPFVVTGPFTIVPFFFASYELGFWLLNQLGLAPAITIHYADIHAMFHGQISMMIMGDRLWHAYLLTWLGSIILGGGLALILYFGVLGGWRLWILWRLRRRRLHRSRF